jgi:uncharacterized protein (TIGR04255 family)
MAIARREIYPSNSLRLVVAEIRFPLSARLSGTDMLAALSSVLGDRLPIIEPGNQILEMSSAGPAPVLRPAGDGSYRFLTRDRMLSVSVDANRLAVEATEYEGWESFREVLTWTLERIGVDLGAIAGLDRIGLRYIDEIRVPGEDAPAERWPPYIRAELLAPIAIAEGWDLDAYQGAFQLRIAPDANLTMRYGTHVGHIVSDSGTLRLPTPAGEGPFFFVDIDSSWTRSGAFDDFDLDLTLKRADELHAPITELFERSITEQLRDDVLRKGAE